MNAPGSAATTAAPPPPALGKRVVVLAVLLPLAVLALALAQPWLSGSGSDAVLGRAVVTVSGAQAVPGATALALVVGAALVAVLTGGPRGRAVAAGLVALAGAGVAALVATTLASAGEVLGRRAAELAGRTGAVLPVEAHSTLWPYAALAASVCLAAAGVLAVVAARRWRGLSARFDRPGAAEADPATARGARRTAWDELSDGHDPTREDAPGAT